MQPIFSICSEDYVYESLGSPATDEDLYLPLEVDTEFYQPSYDPTSGTEPLNITITVQYRSIYQPVGKVYAHSDIANFDPRHPLITYPCSVGNYLNDMGYKVKMTRVNDKAELCTLPTLTLDLFTFFAVAELYRIFTDEYLNDIDYLSITKNPKTGIEQSRRIRTFTKNGANYCDYVFLPWVWEINDIKYKVALRIFDTSAVHGVANYQNFCTNSGIQLQFKDVFSKEEKSKMLDMYFNRSEDFDNYSLGDLYNHSALLGNAENFKKVYESLGISDYYSLPRLTIGSTVSKIVESCIKKLFNAPKNDRSVIKNFCYYSSAEHLKNLVGTTASLNAKVDGGRCRNNRPLEPFIEGIICDNDISGCYGEGLRVQLYPFGRPIIIDYPSDSDRNKFLTLREFLKRYSNELVPSLWQARVSTKLDVTLKYPQDILVSWMPPKDIRKLPTDTEFAQTDEWWSIENTGETKIFRNEVRYSIISHDFIQWLDNVASPRQKNDLLDNLIIVTAAFYPASERLETIEELVSSYNTHDGYNSTFVTREKGNAKKVAIERECYKWYATNLGDLLVNTLLLERKKYPKKTSFNELYKLCTNTVYGDMVSPYFKVGNVIVGNNITARARILAWYMEKGFNGFQTITDGCQFDLNRVTYPSDFNRRVTGENTVDLYSVKPSDRKLSLQPLSLDGNIPERWELKIVDDKPHLIAIFQENSIELNYNDSLKTVAVETFKHLQNLFPSVDILHQMTTDVYGTERKGQFSFEVKNFYNVATFHGTANYSLRLVEGEREIFSNYAMRSYSKHDHSKVNLINEKINMVCVDYRPSIEFLNALKTPRNLKRSNVFIKRKILKLGDYRRNNTKWKETKLLPGYTVESASLLREFSLTQFTYNSYTQYDKWRNEYQKLLKKYGQSYEMYFTNDDGTFDYLAMINCIDSKIREGATSFFDGIDKRSAHTYRNQIQHDQITVLNKLTNELGKRYNIKSFDINCEDNEEIYHSDILDDE